MAVDEFPELQLRREVDAAGGQLVLSQEEMVARFTASLRDFDRPGTARTVPLARHDLETRPSVRDGARAW